MNCEASRVLFLNQTLLQIENYMKNWTTFLPMQCLDNYVLIFSERKWLYFVICYMYVWMWSLWNMNSVILKYVYVFALKQLDTKILSNKYIWLLLKYKNNWRTGNSFRSAVKKHNLLSITCNSLSWQRVKTNSCGVKQFYSYTFLYQNKLFIL